MKILLFALNSSYTHTNLAIRCIKKALQSNGFDAEIAEFNQKDKRLHVLDTLADANADIYGFSAYIWNIREMYAFASDLKKLRPGAHIVFGGPEVSFDADEVLSAHPFIDTVITGEGEKAFCTLASMFLKGEAVPSVVDGGSFDGFETQGTVYTADELQSGSRVVYYESSRGCPYRCAYCLSAMSGKVRAKSAELTLGELLGFEKIGHIKIIKFVDRTFNFDIGRAKEIWRGLLSDKYTKSYHFEICAELLDEESFDLLARFPKGKIQLEAGVQSTNPDTLRRINRSHKTDRLIFNIERLHRLGNMHIHADLIAGLPGETLDSFAAAFDSLFDKCDMLQLGFLKLLRGSELRKRASSFGCIYSDEPPYTVLATDTLSHGELSLLHRIDDLADRYCNGAFSRSVALLTSRTDSPFRMLAHLAEKFSADGIQITELSQPRAFEKLYEYSHIGDDCELAEALLLDHLTTQKQSPPVIGGHSLYKCDTGLRREFMAYADKKGIAYFAPALEERVGLSRYVIDRRNMRAFLYHGEFVEI